MTEPQVFIDNVEYSRGKINVSRAELAEHFNRNLPELVEKGSLVVIYADQPENQLAEENFGPDGDGEPDEPEILAYHYSTGMKDMWFKQLPDGSYSNSPLLTKNKPRREVREYSQFSTMKKPRRCLLASCQTPIQLGDEFYKRGLSTFCRYR